MKIKVIGSFYYTNFFVNLTFYGNVLIWIIYQVLFQYHQFYMAVYDKYTKF